MSSSSAGAHQPTVHALRGLAALMVCWYHLTYGMPGFLDAGWLKNSGAYGYLGVQVFFVLSGFLLPATLLRGRYQFQDFGRFLLKRFARLHPPYLATIAILLGIRYIERWLPFTIRSLPFHWPQFLAHLLYLNPFLGYDWFIAVFWTLAVELQFYLFLAVAFPLLIARRGVGTLVCVALAAATWTNHSQKFLPHHLPVFACGLIAFRYAYLHISRWELAAGLAGAFYWGHRTNSNEAMGVALVTTLLILFVHYSHRLLDFFGDISYSLYLLHVPVGGAVVYEGLQHGFSNKPLLLSLALLASIGAGWALYALVEVPSKGWASRISLRRPVRAPVPQWQPVAAGD